MKIDSKDNSQYLLTYIQLYTLFFCLHQKLMLDGGLWFWTMKKNLTLLEKLKDSFLLPTMKETSLVALLMNMSKLKQDYNLLLTQTILKTSQVR